MTAKQNASGGFIPFLVEDNLDLSSTQTQQVIQVIDQDLAQLLRLPAAQFWHVVAADASLHTCLDSFLRFRRRCYDAHAEGTIQGSSDSLLQLSQRVFRVYWRMVHPEEQRDQKAAAAAGPSASSSKKPQQQSAPSRSQAADLLYNKWLVDVPKMMDLAVLYAPGSSQLVMQLLQQLLILQPKYAQDIANLSVPLTANLHELMESVQHLAHKVLAPAAAAADGSAKQLLSELAEAVAYFLDACLTLQALAECLPQAAALLLQPQHHGQLLVVLAALHSSTVPLLLRVSQQPAAAAVPGLAAMRLQRLQHGIESLVFHLLRAAFCTREGALAAGGPAAVAAMAAAAAGPSGSSKQPPPGFGSSSGSSKGSNGMAAAAAVAAGEFDAESQGQELMNLLMLLAHPADSGVAEVTAAAGTQQHLLAAVNMSHHLDVSVSTAVSEGLLALDDAQFDYFLALVDGDRQLLQQRQQQQQRAAQGATNSSSSSSGPAAGVPASAAAAGGSSGSSSSSSKQPPAAELSSMVASIKELLPVYGDGFLTAALHYNSYNTEQTINCLLEHSLPAALKGLDRGLKTWSPPAVAASGPAAAAGAGGSGSSGSGNTGTSSLSWTGLASEAAAAAAAAAGPQMQHVPLPSLAAAAAAGPKAGVDRRTSRVLGAMSGRLRSVTRSIATEMQFEYDDEYDDSFDDLIGPGNDGVCDIEGDDTGGTGNAAAAAAASRAAAAAGGAAAGAADEYDDEPTRGVGASGTAGPPSRRPQHQQQQQQGSGGRGQQQRKEKPLWVLDGKVYNYKKEGAQQVEGQAGARAALQAAQQAALEIHGLGPGGNVPLPQQQQQQQQQQQKQQQQQQQQQWQPRQQQPQGAGSKGGGAGRGAQGGGPGRGGGRGGAAAAGSGQQQGQQQEPQQQATGGSAGAGARGAGGGRGGGRGGGGRGDYGRKEQHKAAVANHHRKDRAQQKQNQGMW